MIISLSRCTMMPGVYCRGSVEPFPTPLPLPHENTCRDHSVMDLVFHLLKHCCSCTCIYMYMYMYVLFMCNCIHACMCTCTFPAAVRMRLNWLEAHTFWHSTPRIASITCIHIHVHTHTEDRPGVHVPAQADLAHHVGTLCLQSPALATCSSSLAEVTKP